MRAVVACMVVASSAYAEGGDAARLFEQGRAQKTGGDLEAACKSFEQSYELERAAGTALNLAECEERAGNWEYALELYEGAAKVFEQSDRGESARFARERAAALREAHPPERALPAKPEVREQPSSNTWLLGVGISAATVSVIGGIVVAYSYRQIREFDGTDLSGEVITGQSEVTERDCGVIVLKTPSLQGKFEDACAARQRLRWLIPTTFVTGVVGITAIAYWAWKRPRQSNVAVVPTATGGSVMASFEW